MMGLARAWASSLESRDMLLLLLASYPSPFTIRLFIALETTDCSDAFSVHVYSVLICRTGSQILKPVLLLEGPLIPPTPITSVVRDVFGINSGSGGLLVLAIKLTKRFQNSYLTICNADAAFTNRKTL